MKRESTKVGSPTQLISKENQPQVQLMITTVGEIAKLSKWLLEKGSIVVNNAVKDLNEITVKDELLQANITRMSKIGTEASEFKLVEDEKSIGKLFQYMYDFSAMMEDYENMPAESKLRYTLKTALDNNGYVNFEREYEQKVLILLNNFDNAFAAYVKALTPEEKLRDSKLLQWHEDFQAESDNEKKLEKFGELFA
ncbi:unnamed protein product [Ceratitis capitata]|nr:unnamed protein product [Ceratitis capitata]